MPGGAGARVEVVDQPTARARSLTLDADGKLLLAGLAVAVAALGP